MHVNSFEQVATRYIHVWNETDAAARRTAINQLWAEDGGYIDPWLPSRGTPRSMPRSRRCSRTFRISRPDLLARSMAITTNAGSVWELGASAP